MNSSPPSLLPSVLTTATPSGVNRWKKIAPLITPRPSAAPSTCNVRLRPTPAPTSSNIEAISSNTPTTLAEKMPPGANTPAKPSDAAQGSNLP